MSTIYNRNRLSGDAVDFHGPNHVVTAPEILGVRRSAADSNHRASVKSTQGKVDGAGLPSPQNLIIETSIRRPYNFTDAEWDARLASHIEFLSDPAVQAELKAGRLPDDDTITVGVV